MRYTVIEVEQLTDQEVDDIVKEMAGNDDIMFTALSPNPSHPSALFSFPRQGYGDHRHLFMVKTTQLLGTIDELRDGPMKVEHVHDY